MGHGGMRKMIALGFAVAILAAVPHFGAIMLGGRLCVQCLGRTLCSGQMAHILRISRESARRNDPAQMSDLSDLACRSASDLTPIHSFPVTCSARSKETPVE